MKTLPNSDGLVFSPPQPGCVLYLPGLPGGDSKTYDRSPYGNIGTITGATWKKLGSGLWVLDFDGVDDYVDCGAGASLVMTGNPNITVGAWVNVDDYDTHNVVYMYGVRGVASEMFQFYTLKTDGYLAVALYIDGHPTTTQVTTGTWHHITVTMTGTTSKLYLDGEIISTKTDHSTPNIQSGNAYIGNSNDGAVDHDFDGLIGLVRVYNRVLSALEIQNIYQREKHLFGVW